MSTPQQQPRTWLFGLSADEWLHLACEGENSEIVPCCGNISVLRYLLMDLVTCQGQGDGTPRKLAPDVLAAYKVALMGHTALESSRSFPLLHKVLGGLRAELGQA